jgi:hypothetical protein
MTTPWWTKNVYVKSIAVIVGIFIVLVLFVQINHSYNLFSSEKPALQENERLEMSKADSLKALVTTWLDGEFNFLNSFCRLSKFSSEKFVIFL